MDIAVYDVNRYVWHFLTSSGVLNPSEYYAADLDLTIIPIHPVQEVPELANHLDDKPYIVYDVFTGTNTTGSQDEWWVERDEVIYTIYAPSIEKINDIIRSFRNNCKKMDESARSLQQFLSTDTDFWYQELCFDWAEVSESTRDEAGRQLGQVKISYNYSPKTP